MTSKRELEKQARIRRALLELLQMFKTNSEPSKSKETLELSEICPCCESEAQTFHLHHILPRVLGGVDSPTNLIKICDECHAKIHNPHLLKTSEATRKGLEHARSQGKRLGRPKKHDDEAIRSLRRQGLSYAQIERRLQVSAPVIRRAILGTT